ncbi:MAG: hypothetical protein KYX62_13435 [Pseudomonadota bacterium]|nr:hypothetical protein [Pseudomonadota bacterium]
MKKLILASALMAASVGAYASDGECSSVGTIIGTGVSWDGGAYTVCELNTSFTGNATYTLFNGLELTTFESVLFTLPGIVTVGNGYVQNTSYASADKSVLTIEAGVNVVATSQNSALVIARGAKLNALGTANAPVVFSSLDNTDYSNENFTGEGEWGGVILSGYGVANECTSGDTCTMEGISTGYYFGSGSTSKATGETGSGTLTYVVITEGGTQIDVEDPDPVANGGDEINGLTLYAVTSATTINHIHVNENLDDGIEFFGGDVAVEDLFLTCNGDDSVDWDYGFHGSITRVLIEQGDKNGAEDYAFELAGNPNTYSALPTADASVSYAYVEFMGDDAYADTDAVFRIKEGSAGSFSNIVIEGYDLNSVQDCDQISDAGTGLSFANISYDCTVVDSTQFDPQNGSTYTKPTTFWADAPSCN